MFRIRQAQIDVFDDAQSADFETFMVEHLGRFAARHAKILGEDQVRTVIRLGVGNARKYGLTKRSPVRLFVELMFIFGSQFDSDPQLAWAGQVLNDPAIADQKEKTRQLHRLALAYHEHVIGSESVFAINALRRLNERAAELEFAARAGVTNQNLQAFEQIYPEKFARVGDVVILGMVPAAIRIRESIGADSPRSTLLILAGMFAFGHGFYDDPLYPWIAKALYDSERSGPETRLDRVLSRARIYVTHMMTHLEQA